MSDPTSRQLALLDVAHLANRLSQGHYVFTVAMELMADAKERTTLPAKVTAGHPVPLGFLPRRDGTSHAFDFSHYLLSFFVDVELREEIERLWSMGALLTLGDELEKHQYFDRAPILEIVRHLRNAIAHGNRFRIRNAQQLAKFPAHTANAYVRGDKGTVFHIDPSLNGTEALFKFMGPGDVSDVLMSVELYLRRLAD